MSQTSQWATGILVAVVLAALAIAVDLRPERRRRVAAWLSQSRLVSRRAGATTLEVLVGGKKVGDPRLVVVNFVSHGRLDIPSSAFDQGRPVILDVGAPIRGLVDCSGAPADAFSIDASSVSVLPHLIKAGVQYRWELVCDGDATLTSTAPLIDADLMDPRQAWLESGRRERPWTIAAALLAVALLAIGIMNLPRSAKAHGSGGDLLLGLPERSGTGGGSAPMGWPGYMIVGGFVLLFVVIVLSSFGWRRDKRTAQRLLAAELGLAPEVALFGASQGDFD